ncbi:MAG: DUF11 domain-containing protein, partial [Propionibacteriaceae bacterium]|nr:DUF11 domain-containing protein [Propionibacteriaceae bacterium]
VGTTDLDPVTVTDDLSGVLAHAQMVVGSLSAQVVDGSSSAPAGGVPVHAPSVSDTTLTWTGVLSVGQSVTVSYRVVVNSDVTPGDRLVNHVVGKGTDPDEPETEVPGTCVTGKDPECTTDHPVGVPKLVLEKTADPASGSTVRPGDTVTYSVTATNVGTVDLDPVTVTDDLSGVLAHAQMVDGSLSARMVDGSLSAPVVDGSRPAPVVDGSTPTPVVDSSTPTQVVDGSRPTQVNGAHVADPLLSGTTLTWTGALSPGQSVTVSYQVVVSDTARPGDALVNHVVGTGTDPDDPDTDVPSTCVTGHEPACTTTHPAGVPKLVIEKLADADSQQGVHPGQIVTYTVTASNQGTVDLDPATVVDDLSLVVAHARLVDDSVSASVMGVPVAPPRVADHLVTWSGPLAVGETLTLTYQVQVDLDIRPGDLLVNRVHGTGTDPEDPDTDVPATCVDGEEEGCSVTLVPRVPRLHVVKESDPPSGATVRPGQRVTYTVTTTNVGQVRLDPVSVVDNLSGVLPLARFEDGSQTAVLDGVPTAAPVLLGSSLTWMGPMGPGSVLRMTYQVVVDEDLDARASLLNRVIAQGVDPDSRGDDVPSTCVAGDEDGCWTTHTPDLPRLVVHKASNPPSGSTVSPGDVISYTVTASNAGNRHLDPVRLVDDMSAVVSHADLAYASLSASIDGREVDPPVWTGTTLTWSGPLAVGATVTLTYQAVVVAGDGGTLWNLVQGTGHDPDDPGSEVPSTCVTGLEEGCSVTVTVPPPPSPPHGIIVATGGTAHTSATWTALASALVLAGAGAWGMVRARGRKQE